MFDLKHLINTISIVKKINTNIENTYNFLTIFTILSDR